MAIVTGASRGIGRGLTAALLGAGYCVVGCSRTERDPLAGPYEHRPLDVADPAAVRALVASVERDHGRIDVLVNNAAEWTGALLLMTQDDQIERIVRTNILGTMLVTREVARIMVSARSGRVVTIGSSAVPVQMAGSSVYSATKAALVQFTKVVANELAPFGITCNVVAPSIVDTEMSGQLEPKARAALLGRLAFKRPATMDDVANAVLFFLQPESAHVTGQVLYLGLTA